METVVCSDSAELARRAGGHGAQLIKTALAGRGSANVIFATGASQFGVLESLAKAPGIRWDRVTGFHLDEYIGVPITHPASFRLYLWERFISRLHYPLKAFHYIDGESEYPAAECERVGRIISENPIDVAFIGIGENGHVAFNDPPADFETEEPYILVDLDLACRRQQFGEGWFKTLEDVPTKALSMSCRQILKSREIICSVPDSRKAAAVRAALSGPVTPDVPASILQTHERTTIYLDPTSSSLLGAR